MAELKLWQRVNNLTGQSSKSRNLVPFINNASKWLINSLPEKFLWSIASTTEDDTTQNGLVGREGDVDVVGTGSGIAYDKILAVWRYETTYSSGTANDGTIGKRVKRPCLEIPDSLLYATDESDSIHFPTRMFPKFYKLAGKIYVKPDPDYNEEAAFDAGTPGDDLVYSDPAGTTVTVSGQNGDKAVIVYAAPPLATENTDSWILAEWDNVVIMYAASQDMLRLSNAEVEKVANATTGLLKLYQDGLPTYTPPVVPALPTFSYSGSLPTFDSSGLTFDPDTALSLPSYVSEVMSSLPTLSIVNDIATQTGQTFPTLSASSFPVPPTPPAGPSFTYVTPTTVDLPSGLEALSTTLPSFVPPSVSISFTDFDAEMTKAKDWMKKGLETVEYNSTSNISRDGDDAVLSIGYDLWNEDVEVVQAKLGAMASDLSVAGQEMQKQAQKLSQYQADVQKESGRVQSQLSNYTQELNKVVQNAQTKMGTYTTEQKDKQSDLQASMEEYKDRIGKFNSDLQSYSAQVTKVVNEYQTEANTLISQFQAETGTQVAEYQAIVNAYVNEFQAKYQQALQKYQQEYQNELGRYTAKFNTSLQEFNALVAKYATENQLRLTEYQQKAGAEIQKYGAELQGQQTAFESNMNKAKNYVEQAQIRLANSKDLFTKSSTFYQWAINELRSGTGALSAPPQQQAAQRGEEQSST